jgi:hypothetical protein
MTDKLPTLFINPVFEISFSSCHFSELAIKQFTHRDILRQAIHVMSRSAKKAMTLEQATGQSGLAEQINASWNSIRLESHSTKTTNEWASLPL